MTGLLKLFIICLTLNCHTVFSSSDQAVNYLWQTTSSTSSSTQEKAALDLIRRILPQKADHFQVKVDLNLLKPDNKDKFVLQSVANETILISGTSGVSVANGFNYYLKRYLNCHISWSGNQLSVPSTLPPIKSPVQVVIQDKFRYYENVCTVSYSMVWWDFGRWQQEIDWMALNAINFPLAFNGQELIWRKVFQKIGLTVEEVDDYFTGPAFLAWNRMGNIQRWSGPLTENWHKYQAVLQTNILDSMRSLGMIPVLPAFAGHVPVNITRVLPDAHISILSDWNDFKNDSKTSFLEPDDPHFIEIGASFIDEYRKQYGIDHFYNTDLFNEMTPQSKEPKYLSDCGKAVYQSLVKADPQAVWVMQGWLFESDPGFWTKERAKALVTSVPQDKLLILDLMSELHPQFSLLDGYWGQPFIWCMLHNFGGALGMYGAFNHLNLDVFESRKNYPNMIGIGLTPEGILQNPVVYEFMTETTWYTSKVDLDKWITDYAYRRYGFINDDLTRAWNLLQNSVYIDPIKVSNHGRYVINHRPSLNSQSVLWYNASDVLSAFKLFVNSSSVHQLENNPTFQYDLIDITRQYLQLGFDLVYHTLVDSYKQRKQIDFDNSSQLLLEVLDDMDSILSTNDNFLLGRWIDSARALANTEQEKSYNEQQAKNQVTIWGPDGNILDYANKHWSGLFSHYYKPRWQLFLQVLYKSLRDKTPYNQSKFNQLVFEQVELKFVNDHFNYETKARGRSMATWFALSRVWPLSYLSSSILFTPIILYF